MKVATQTQLSNALNAAAPGDSIVLATGTYRGKMTITRSGTSCGRIYLTGPRSANIGGTGTAPSAMNLRIRASHWTISGFSMKNTYQPVFLEGARYVTIRNLEIAYVGQEAIHLKASSIRNVVESNYIHDTGKYRAQYGEAIYIGYLDYYWPTCRPPTGPTTT